MLKDLSIKTKLGAGFGAIVAIILVLLALAYTNFSKLSAANAWDRHTLQVLLEANRIETALVQIQTSTRGFMLTGEESLTAPIAAEEALARRHQATLAALTADNPAQQQRLTRLAPMIDAWIERVIHPLLDKRRALNKQVGVSQQVATPADVLNGAKTIADARALLGEISAEENRLLEQRAAASAELQHSMSLLLILGGSACVVLAAVIGYLLSQALLGPLNHLTAAVGRITGGDQSARAQVLSGDELGRVGTAFNHMAQTIQDSQANELAATNLLRSKVDALLGVVSKAASGDLTGRIEVGGADAIGQLAHGLARMFDNLRALLNDVQKAGIQVTTAATQIAASAKQQEATGIEQAQTSVEVLSTTREISANTAELLRTMEDATAVADYTTSATAEAQNNLQRMDGTMQHMVAATDSINAKLAALSEKASNINSVLITITKVADQTNILSLNAAIEAEKAGDAGRGFSVVATEIRRLADQTSVSTWDIEQMLKEMQSAVSASVMGMDKFSEEIRRSVGEVRQVTDQLSGVMDQVQKLAPRFDAVLQGMQSQAVGAQQISETMTLLSDATQQTVDSLKATSEAVHQLQYAAGDLQSSVANFAVAA
ncbi:methyl-accepting chemotaxis protein WspA [Duganella sp. 1411]|jgi:methyl-accepting chemotaxis protein WspA|uniref:methyl-accepting chemotaxis protein n=1 Tax=Duganella sp. 1411 TaxID=2806572 RepID=UPI001AE29DF1|nr:methyl-accepting chemotaxis protein [Duganella sp. 1411]MBP1205353.1 methyl-accepting chemotaxis protein WspA [Duganella sp. 1411]